MRKTREELEIIKTNLNINTLWSWSRFNTYKNDKFEYLLKYIKRIKEDKANSIYSYSGSLCHDIIEKFYNGQVKKEEMLSLYEDGLFEMNIAEYKYNRSDNDKNEKTANKYENCIKHFFKNHNKPSNLNMILEMFILIKINNDLYFHGYIDNVGITQIDNEKHIIITDYKTSTIYKGEKLEKEIGQLCLYAEGIRQKTQLPLDHIHIRYLFLKYVTVDCMQANEKIKARHIERNSIGESLASNIKMWLKKNGYDEIDIEKYLSDVILKNDLSILPKEIQEKFVVKDCYIDIPLSEEIIVDLKNEISNTIGVIEQKTKEYKVSEDENLFWQEVTQQDEFRLNTLSGYSRKIHKPFAEYLKAKEMFQNKNEDEDINDDDNIMEWLDKL